MWAKFPINILLPCSFMPYWNFFMKKSFLWQNQIITWITCFSPLFFVFFLLLSVWGTFTCWYQGGTWLILSIQQVVRGALWAYIVKYKIPCLQMCVILFSTPTWKEWSVLFHLSVWNCLLRFLNKKYEINCRIMASKQDKKVLLCMNKMLCWKRFTMNQMKVKNLFLERDQ